MRFTPNEYIAVEGVCHVKVTHKKSAPSIVLVDREDWVGISTMGRLNITHCGPKAQKKYAYITITEDGKRVPRWLHRIIMNAGPGQEVDHKHGNTLDNRKSELRLVNHSVNMLNQQVSIKNRSGYRGVSLHVSGRWRATIKVNKKQLHLGYGTKEECADMVSLYLSTNHPVV